MSDTFPENERPSGVWRIPRALVVDDEPGIRKLIRRILDKQEVVVQEAESGEAAKAMLVQGLFDVIICDIALPGINGMQFLRAVRAVDYDVPVILITGHPSFESAVEAVEFGAFHYFTKPFDHEEFQKVATRAIHVGRLAKIKRKARAALGEEPAGAGDLAGIAESFDRALAGLWMAYQPLLLSSDKSVFGYEALMRSKEPTLPHPGAILDAAERLGELEELGRLVRRKAAEPVVQRPDVGLLFVNLHPADLMDPELADPAGPLAPIADRVVFEITERASLRNLEEVRARVSSLRQLGYRIAVDDLGAGYAGLTSLATLQPEIVKIDMSLVRNVNAEPVKQSLIRSLVRVSKEMNILVVAEGVETEGERDCVVDLGCDLLQGYRFARPGPAFPAASW